MLHKNVANGRALIRPHEVVFAALLALLKVTVGERRGWRWGRAGGGSAAHEAACKLRPLHAGALRGYHLAHVTNDSGSFHG